MPEDTTIGPGMRVALTFSLKLDTGELIDSTGNRPAEFTVGDGSLLPGFERAMFGLQAGEARTLLIPAENGFGESNPDNVQIMKRSDFDDVIELSEGLIVSFADQQNTELPGVIKRILGESVEVDLNHPLAGRDLLFDVEVLSVEQVSNEILRA
jgi:FKBP-type peptidyl-prolyl cis-trans isomerase SlpA